MTGPVVAVTGFDHVVLRCADVERTLAWYRDVLGLEGVHVEGWRLGEAPFPSVRIDATTLIDLVAGDPTPGRLDHLCLVVAPTDLDELARSPDLDVVEGPVVRYGAQGDGRSLYVRDPDGTVVELKHH